MYLLPKIIFGVSLCALTPLLLIAQAEKAELRSEQSAQGSEVETKKPVAVDLNKQDRTQTACI